MMAHSGNDALQVVIIQRVSFLIALALMLDKTFDVVAFGEVGQTVINLSEESLQ